jgi:hypothetical protein
MVSGLDSTYLEHSSFEGHMAYGAFLCIMYDRCLSDIGGIRVVSVNPGVEA